MFSLHAAVKKNNFELVKECIELLQQEEITVNLVDEEGYTPLHIAAKNGYMSIVKFLLQKGANINISISEHVETPLLLAIKNEHINIVRMLLERGADINQRLPKGYAPLHCAVKVRHLGIIQLLLLHGADINLRDVAHGYAPLHLAVIYYNLERQEGSTLSIDLYVNIINYLLENGADIDVRNWDEETPLHCAARQNQLSLIKLLLEKGADSSLESSDGHTPMDLVTEGCLHDFIKYIALYGKTLPRKDRFQYEFWVACKNELQKMKESTFKNSNVSWYTFLTQNNENHLEAYICNSNICKELETQDYEHTFSLYSSNIKAQIVKGEKRYSLTQDIMNYFYLELPIEDCWRKILCYLSTSDLENFVDVIYRKPK